ncbi:MAG: hypothetical protein A6D91_07905 [Bacillaceae bacterium G1]|nr:acyl-CoA thioesterase [Bacillota bacterium]OJF17639.1 MAG: hypothetical protein A6D91_07905 [Bacillaceae bacterium G1]
MSVQRTEVVVRPTDIDVLGHVNNARYLEYLEWGRVQWYRSHSNLLSSTDISFAVVSIHINYRREVKMEDRLTVLTGLVRLGNSSMTFRQEIVNEAGQLVADADVVAVLFHTRQRKSVPIPDALRTQLEGLLVESLTA